MVSQLELVKKFCSTYDIKYFFMLNKETQKFFKEAAYYLLGLHDEINYLDLNNKGLIFKSHWLSIFSKNCEIIRYTAYA